MSQTHRELRTPRRLNVSSKKVGNIVTLFEQKKQESVTTHVRKTMHIMTEVSPPVVQKVKQIFETKSNENKSNDAFLHSKSLSQETPRTKFRRTEFGIWKKEVEELEKQISNVDQQQKKTGNPSRPVIPILRFGKERSKSYNGILRTEDQHANLGSNSFEDRSNDTTSSQKISPHSETSSHSSYSSPHASPHSNQVSPKSPHRVPLMTPKSLRLPKLNLHKLNDIEEVQKDKGVRQLSERPRIEDLINPLVDLQEDSEESCETDEEESDTDLWSVLLKSPPPPLKKALTGEQFYANRKTSSLNIPDLELLDAYRFKNELYARQHPNFFFSVPFLNESEEEESPQLSPQQKKQFFDIPEDFNRWTDLMEEKLKRKVSETSIPPQSTVVS